MKKKLYYSDRVKLEKTFLGVVWTISGVLGFWDGIISLVMQAIASVICIYTLLRVSFAQKEDADEMAEQNMNRAKALTHDYMQIVYCCFAIAAILFLKNMKLAVSLSELIPNITFIVLGINHLVVGLTFRKLEEE